MLLLPVLNFLFYPQVKEDAFDGSVLPLAKLTVDCSYEDTGAPCESGFAAAVDLYLSAVFVRGEPYTAAEYASLFGVQAVETLSIRVGRQDHSDVSFNQIDESY